MMAKPKLEYTVTIKNIEVVDLLAETIALQNELVDLIPEWMIERERIVEELSEKWSEIVNKSVRCPQ